MITITWSNNMTKHKQMVLLIGTTITTHPDPQLCVLPSMPYCQFCDVTFDTRGQRDHHQVNCQGVLTLQYSNGAITIMKDDQGQYVCHCAHPNCPKPYYYVSFNVLSGRTLCRRYIHVRCLLCATCDQHTGANRRPEPYPPPCGGLRRQKAKWQCPHKLK